MNLIISSLFHTFDYSWFIEFTTAAIHSKIRPRKQETNLAIRYWISACIYYMHLGYYVRKLEANATKNCINVVKARHMLY